MKSLIRLSIRHRINMHSAGHLQKNIFNDSYQEFLLQAQTYNPGNKWKTLSDIINDNPKAISLHYKVGFSIALYVKQMENKTPEGIPGLSRRMSFDDYRFRIIESDITTPGTHQVELTFITVPCTLFDSIGPLLLLAEGDNRNNNPEKWHDVIQIMPDDNTIFVSAYYA